VFLPHEDLWGQVLHGATPLAQLDCFAADGFIEFVEVREAKVGDDNGEKSAEEDAGRFQVSVDDAHPME
jgi:hypothetical protein